MRKILSITAMMLLAVGMVSAAPNFEFDKTAFVSGEWKWEDSAWQSGDWLTGVFEHGGVSNHGLNHFYVESERLDEWRYDLESYWGSDNTGHSYTGLHAWTVNDPETTPATGGYTISRLSQDTYSDYSHSHIEMRATNAVNYESSITAIGSIEQDTHVDMN